jgi:hypothetical protein
MSDCPAECYWGNENDFITIDNIAPELEEISIEVQ